MQITKEIGTDVFIKLPCGTDTVISTRDKWILDVFPVWGTTGSRSKYVFCERTIKTEYSLVRERVYLHRIICKPIGKEQVDHIDMDRLNNRRSNLRICSRQQNAANVKRRNYVGYKGVYDKSRYQNLKKPFAARYTAFIDAKSRGIPKRTYVGYFKTAEEAARAYDKRAKEVWGEFAYLNFPEEP